MLLCYFLTVLYYNVIVLQIVRLYTDELFLLVLTGVCTVFWDFALSLVQQEGFFKDYNEM